jgi:hypothetical protein
MPDKSNHVWDWFFKAFVVVTIIFLIISYHMLKQSMDLCMRRLQKCAPKDYIQQVLREWRQVEKDTVQSLNQETFFATPAS